LDKITELCDNNKKELITMELVIGLISFVGDVLAAWAMSAYGYFQEKLSND
jgi:hypothetical protein